MTPVLAIAAALVGLTIGTTLANHDRHRTPTKPTPPTHTGRGTPRGTGVTRNPTPEPRALGSPPRGLYGSGVAESHRVNDVNRSAPVRFKHSESSNLTDPRRRCPRAQHRVRDMRADALPLVPPPAPSFRGESSVPKTWGVARHRPENAQGSARSVCAQRVGVPLPSRGGAR
jgi:hypothetical protein